MAKSILLKKLYYVYTENIRGENKLIDCLDKGYVRLVDHMGTDLSVVNAARASFMKESEVFGTADEKLIKYLIRNNEWSPFRHAFISFEVKAPLMVARQWFKYIVGSDHTMDAWNEASWRYLNIEPEIYIPDEWRSVPESRKQGSGGNIDTNQSKLATKELVRLTEQSLALFEWATKDLNICNEQARLFLPANGLYTVWRWSASVNSVCWFLKQRLAEDNAQHEIVVYANAIKELIEPLFPSTVQWFMEYKD